MIIGVPEGVSSPSQEETKQTGAGLPGEGTCPSFSWL